MNQSEENVEPLAGPNCKACGHRQVRHSTQDKQGLKSSSCEVCDCAGYEPLSSHPTGYDPQKDPFNDPKSPQSIDRKLFPAVKKWAHSYNGYERFAGEHWADLLEPLWAMLRDEQEIPKWVGVDLLRAWAFYMARGHNWSCMGDGYLGCHTVIYRIADAVQNHEAARKSDLPPRIPKSFVESLSRR